MFIYSTKQLFTYLYIQQIIYIFNEIIIYIQRVIYIFKKIIILIPRIIYIFKEVLFIQQKKKSLHVRRMRVKQTV